MDSEQSQQHVLSSQPLGIQFSQLKDDLRDTRREKDRLEHENLRLQGDLERRTGDLGRQISNYANDLQAARQERDCFRRDAEEKQLEIGRLRENGIAKQHELDCLRAQCDAQQKELEALHAKCNAQQEALQAARADCDAQRGELQALRSKPASASRPQDKPTTGRDVKTTPTVGLSEQPIVISDDDEDDHSATQNKASLVPSKDEPSAEVESLSTANKNNATASRKVEDPVSSVPSPIVTAKASGALAALDKPEGSTESRSSTAPPEPEKKRLRLTQAFMDASLNIPYPPSLSELARTTRERYARRRNRMQTNGRQWETYNANLSSHLPNAGPGKETETANAQSSISAPAVEGRGNHFPPTQSTATSSRDIVTNLPGRPSTDTNDIYRPRYASDIPISLNARVAAYSSYLIPTATSVSTSSSSSLPAVNPLAGYVSRRFLCHQYGCSPQAWLAKIKPSNNVPQGSQRRIVFSQWANNPGLPPAPGEPGTIIANRLEILEDPPWSVFVRANSEPVWQYRGEYEVEKSESPLSAAEFRNLPREVRRQWAKDILRPQSWWCYTSARARTALRRHQLAVTPEAIRQEVKQRSLAVDEQDMLNALDSGEEILNVLVLKPVGYDSAFQADIEAKFADWNKEAIVGSSKTQSQTTRKRKRTSEAQASPARAPPAEVSDPGLTEPEYSEYEDLE